MFCKNKTTIGQKSTQKRIFFNQMLSDWNENGMNIPMNIFISDKFSSATDAKNIFKTSENILRNKNESKYWFSCVVESDWTIDWFQAIILLTLVFLISNNVSGTIVDSRFVCVLLKVDRITTLFALFWSVKSYSAERTCGYNEICKEEFRKTFRCKCPSYLYCR